MPYRIPDDELLTDAIANVLLKNKTVVSQRELCDLVTMEINRGADIPYRVSGNRIRRLSIQRGLVSLDIEYRESSAELPDVCPVCGHGLDPITNSTLEGGLAVIKKKCRKCGYSASARSSIPSKYTFNMRPRKLSELADFRLERMTRAREHLTMAGDILESLIDGHVLAHDAKITLNKLRDICDSTEEPGSLRNMIRSLEDNEGEPVWCRPLDSIKYPKEKELR